MTTVGILLAGGLSRRYGSPKAFAKADGKYFYEQVYDALEAAADQVVVVARPEFADRFPEVYDVITDLPEVAGLGPLAGIFSAMCTHPADRYIVLPCDMPYIGRTEVRRLMEASGGSEGVTAVATAAYHVPLFSVWSNRMRDEVEQELAQGQLSVMRFLERVPAIWIGSERIHADEGVFCNINKPDDQRKGGRHT
ncbi:molybdenum cofactor guanylyltransferase [Planococcus lenghuensis]|uniref:Probable molybdenum cofactor guanylyltransferase n=1 Tax=Planococcus lenghuensis TaxID=2213202 RepID=A0A1Q2KVW3_9BACL|nr:molybdenum cofactor guanylyltransferase [Planococcus lenghuensis]AQQ51947.1 molybdenum cofactor guanylyltransferase [Planococcus lenghuensis]